MVKYITALFAGVFILAGIAIPVAFAAYDSGTFANDTTIHISSLGIDLVVAGGSRVSQMHVMPDSVEFILDAGSSVTVRSYDHYALNNAVMQPLCKENYSEVSLQAESWKTLLITPSLSRCSGFVPSGGAIVPSGSGGSVHTVSTASTSSIVIATTTSSTTTTSVGIDVVTQLRLQLIELLKQLISLLMMKLQSHTQIAN
ncbi:MAG: hypothetical protein KBC26_00215 [Candidatus Pacebacteria bacterium]|nr:hypothetical protein [Candidatus Paceibacterota bacterium]